MKSSKAGFTLIELLVVITIISLLMVTLLPNVFGATVTANKLAEQTNLKWHFENMTMYKAQRGGRMPRGGGHDFIFDPWIKGVVSHSSQNIDRYFSPMTRGVDEFFLDLKDRDPKEIWKDGTTSEDTDYAGRARAHKKSMQSDDQIIMATDNEAGNIYKDGTVIVLFFGGHIQQFDRKHLSKYGYSDDVDEEEHIEVGPNSLVPALKKLDF